MNGSSHGGQAGSTGGAVTWQENGLGVKAMRNRWLRHGVLALLDGAVVAIALIIALILRFEGDVPDHYIGALPGLVALSVVLRFVFFNVAGLYRSLWRYASIRELVTMTVTTALSTGVLYGIDRIFRWFSMPRSIYLIDFLLVLFGIGFIRFLVRYRRQFMQAPRQNGGKRVLIYGAGEAGTRLLEDFQSHPQIGLQVVGFVDDNPTKVNRTIHGVPILGSRDELCELTEQHRIQQIIIAMPAVPKATIHEIVDVCKHTKAELKILPPIHEILNGRVRMQDVRDVQIEDLLRRDPVQTDLSAISGYLKGQRILVTGAGGSIGSELCRQISAFKPSELMLLGHGENSIFDINNELGELAPDLVVHTIIADIRDQEKIDRIFQDYRPQVVFHAAAHKHVPLMEANPDEAVINNVFGTRNVATAAHNNGAECFVMVSTDKAVNAGNVMGATKRVAEMVVQSLARRSDTRFVSVRFGNVLGSRGSVIPFFKKQIERGGPVTVTHPEMKRYFMTIPEAVQLVMQAGAIGKGGEVFVLDMGEPVRIVDLARDLIRLSGLEPGKDIEIVFTGTRPGEKLFEELINANEAVSKTQHDKIVQLLGTGPSRSEMQARLDALQRRLDATDLEGLKDELYEIVGAKPAEHYDVEPGAERATEEIAAGLRQAAAADGVG